MAETDNVVPLIPEINEAEHPAGIEMVEWVFTNDKTNEYPRMLFHGLYQGAFANKLGIIQTKAAETDEVHTLICGIELVPDQAFPNIYPLAKVLTAEELDRYKQFPDGNGNYIS